ncbi:MAG: hypothetical protein ACI9MC_002754 [Kiritimatiellia bacterium]|jgi:hypothetical protein
MDSLSLAGPVTAATKNVVARATGSDLDKLRWTYAWYLDGKKQNGTGGSIGVVLKRGNRVFVDATGNDGDDRATKRSLTLTAQNSLPVILKVTLTPVRSHGRQ